ncbi:hypothetical protein Cgig2_007609 [Carnegiea gigantea]|uniref:Uncharacterized protein n=1 Tax=Carnegiea gigantea TaxID=171969 RepID=A0A9Q1JU60_9CARY|nr:hypothetical protein Cgig2_007609 [Carnegiea gigantea]
MKYSWNAVCETLRLVVPGQGGGFGEVNDFKFEGFNIPKAWKFAVVHSRGSGGGVHIGCGGAGEYVTEIEEKEAKFQHELAQEKAARQRDKEKVKSKISKLWRFFKSQQDGSSTAPPDTTPSEDDDEDEPDPSDLASVEIFDGLSQNSPSKILPTPYIPFVHYNKPAHEKEQCYELVGYPTNWGTRRNNRLNQGKGRANLKLWSSENGGRDGAKSGQFFSGSGASKQRGGEAYLATGKDENAKEKGSGLQAKFGVLTMGQLEEMTSEPNHVPGPTASVTDRGSPVVLSPSSPAQPIIEPIHANSIEFPPNLLTESDPTPASRSSQAHSEGLGQHALSPGPTPASDLQLAATPEQGESPTSLHDSRPQHHIEQATADLDPTTASANSPTIPSFILL